MSVVKTILFGILCGWAVYAVAQPPLIADTAGFSMSGIELQSGDSLSLRGGLLEDVVIEAVGSRKLLHGGGAGNLYIDASSLSDMPSILGGGDALTAIRFLGPVSTASDLTASMSIRGLPTGESLFSVDGIRVGMPLHMLGFYSAFPPGYYDKYSLSTFPDVSLRANSASGVLDASCRALPDSILSGNVSFGLIESHASIALPLGRKRPASLSAAFRHSYLNQVFPDILKAGSSELAYSFFDGAASFRCRISSEDLLSLSFMGSSDRLGMHNDKFGKKEADAGWTNIAGGLTLMHGKYTFSASFMRFSNLFSIEQGDREVSLPSELREAVVSVYWADTDWRAHFDSSLRHSSGQRNHALTKDSSYASNASLGWETNISVGWRKRLSSLFSVDIGSRLSYYHTRFRHVDTDLAAAQPRVSLAFYVSDNMSVSIRYARLMRFDRLIEESQAGMPVNYFTNCSHIVPVSDNHSLELDVAGTLPSFLVDWQISLYGIRMRNAGEYGGSILNFISTTYDPLADVHYGNGYSAGMTVALARQFGALRGRINYNLGFSRVKIPFYSQKYFPSAADRTHDLNVNLTWRLFRRFILSGNFTLASGTPYTRARYGYIIGENLICEYFPHNSSRLPLYRRLDLSLAYSFSTRRFRHEINLTLYNALAFRNTLFVSYGYSVESGVEIKESVMKSVIPSIAYTVSF